MRLILVVVLTAGLLFVFGCQGSGGRSIPKDTGEIPLSAPADSQDSN